MVEKETIIIEITVKRGRKIWQRCLVLSGVIYIFMNDIVSYVTCYEQKLQEYERYF